MYSQFSVSLCSQAKVFLFADTHCQSVVVLPEHCITNSQQSGLPMLMFTVHTHMISKTMLGTSHPKHTLK